MHPTSTMTIATYALLLASCGQTQEQKQVAKDQPVATPLVQIGTEEFCENQTLKTRGLYSADGGKTTIPIGVRIVEPRKRC